MPKTASNDLKLFSRYCDLKFDIFRQKEMNSGYLINIHEVFYDVIVEQ